MSPDTVAKLIRLPLGEEPIRPSLPPRTRGDKRGVWPIAGCDEAGRGPLAGPVVAAAVILDPDRVPRGLNDSKKLDREEREKLHAKICASAEVAVSLRAAVAHRPRQHPARVAVGAGLCGEGAAGQTQAGLRRWARPHRRRLRLHRGDPWRRHRRVDRRGVDRRQGDPRPPDAAGWRSPIPATALSATWATACPSIRRPWQTRTDDPLHRRSFAPVAARYLEAGADPDEVIPAALPL